MAAAAPKITEALTRNARAPSLFPPSLLLVAMLAGESRARVLLGLLLAEWSGQAKQYVRALEERAKPAERIGLAMLRSVPPAIVLDAVAKLTPEEFAELRSRILADAEDTEDAG
jgi:hypothetical protein